MKLSSRVALAGPGWDGNSGQRNVAARLRVHEGTLRTPATTPITGHYPPQDVGAGGGSAFAITCITAEFGLPRWTGEWRRLLTESRSPEKIYQTPEFFRFLVDSQTTASDQFELFVVRHRVQDKIVGIVPVRISTVALDFSVATWQPRVVRLLGSVPLLPDDAALLHQLFAHLLRAFPECAAVSMQAFPRELQGLPGADRRHQPFVMHGWRACHTIPLPADLPSYMGKMSAKKRYNLGRQYRLLEQATGPLTLVRIDRSAAVKDLVEGVLALAPDGDRARTAARDYRVLAANRLLLSYVLRSRDEVVAVIAGSRYGDTWHVHQIMYAPHYRRLSAGTVALHTALQDVITSFAFTTADLGFGTPRDRFASTHVLQARAHVLVGRRGAWSALLLGAFVRLDAVRTACAGKIKPLIRNLRSQ
jgi:CelD/BcsL family acetyltransferase involved in cellulose biosynthesis